MRIPQILLVDDFLDEPDRVRAVALTQTFAKMHSAGLRTQSQFLHLAPYRKEFDLAILAW